MMDRSERARKARYAQVRAQKDFSRDDVTALTFNQRMFRTILSKSLEIVGWNYEVEHEGIPLWFDACVLVKMERGKKRMCMVDIKPTGHGADYTRRSKRKQNYCTQRDVPYLEVPNHAIQEELMMFKLRVQRGDYDQA